MKIIPFEPEIHETLVKQWWDSQQNVDFPIKTLPTIGLVGLAEDRPVALAFLYTTNSTIAWIGWPLANPESDAKTRSTLLDMVLEGLHDIAKEQGHSLMWAISGIPALQKRYERLGYVIGDAGVNQYFKGL